MLLLNKKPVLGIIKILLVYLLAKAKILILNKNLFQPSKFSILTPGGSRYFNLQNSLFWLPVGVDILILNKSLF